MTHILFSSACGGVYPPSTTGGVIRSPNYPDSYPVNQSCVWQVAARTGKTISVEFENPFSITESINCTNDYVKVIIIIHRYKDRYKDHSSAAYFI